MRVPLSLPHLSLAFLGLMVALPFLVPIHRNPLATFYNEWAAFVPGLLAAMVLAGRRAWDPPAFPAAAVFLLGGIAVLIAHSAIGLTPYVEHGLMAALYLSWAVLLVWAGDLLRRELGMNTVVTALAWCVLAGGLLSAGAALFQYYRVPALTSLIFPKVISAATGNVGQANHLASYCALALAALAYLYGSRRLGAIGASCAGTMLLFAATLSASRSMWIYLCAFVGLALLWRRRASNAGHQRLVLACALLLPGFALLNWLATLPALVPLEGEVITPLWRLFASATGASVRFELWRDAWGLFMQAPWFGVGYGSFAWNYFLQQTAPGPGASPAALDYVMYHNAHNLALQLLAETGLAGLCLALAAATAWLLGVRRLAVSAELWWVLAALAVIAIHSLLEYPLWYAFFLGLAALLLGIGSTHHLTLRLGGAGRLGAAVVVGLGLWSATAVFFDYVKLERQLFSAQLRELRGANVRPWVEALMARHRDPLLRPYVELVLALASPLDEVGLAHKLELNSRVLRFMPIDDIAYRQAVLLALAGEREAALAQAARALRSYPGAWPRFRTEVDALAERFPGRFEPLLELAEAAAPRSAAK